MLLENWGSSSHALADQEDDIDEYQEGGTQHVVAKSEFVVELAEGVYQSLL